MSSTRMPVILTPVRCSQTDRSVVYVPGRAGIGCEYRARYYHPGLQRFIGEDPIGFFGGDLNLYAYVCGTAGPPPPGLTVAGVDRARHSLLEERSRRHEQD